MDLLWTSVGKSKQADHVNARISEDWIRRVVDGRAGNVAVSQLPGGRIDVVHRGDFPKFVLLHRGYIGWTGEGAL